MRALCSGVVPAEPAVPFSRSCLEAIPKYPPHRQGAHLKSHEGSSWISKATDRVVLDTGGHGDNPLPPWLFGFQCNERYLAWDESAHVQLLKIYSAKEMGKDVRWVEEQLSVLGTLLPDLIMKLPKMKAGLLLALVKDTQGTAEKMLHLKDLLPRVDVSQLVAGCPALLLNYDAPTLEANLAKLREAVDGKADVERLVEREPMLLAADVGVLLEEAERLLPAGKDPVSFLAASPGTLLDMQQAGLPSTIDGDLWTADESF